MVVGSVGVPDQLGAGMGTLIHAILFLGPVRWGGVELSEDSDDMMIYSVRVSRIVRER